MTDISRALYAGIVDGKYTPDSESVDPQVILRTLRAEFSSERAMTNALGLPRSSVRRWLRGTRPNQAGFAALQAAQRRMRLPREREDWMRVGHIVVNSIVLFSGESVKFRRLITDWPSIPKAPRRYQPDGVQDRILDAWLAANDIAAVNALIDVVWAGLNYSAGRDTDKTLGDVVSIKWYKTASAARHAMKLRDM